MKSCAFLGCSGVVCLAFQWGNDDRIYDYKDVEYTGEIVFRIEDVKRISLVNKAPVIGMGYEQYEADKSEANPVVELSEESS